MKDPKTKYIDTLVLNAKIGNHDSYIKLREMYNPI